MSSRAAKPLVNDQALISVFRGTVLLIGLEIKTFNLFIYTVPNSWQAAIYRHLKQLFELEVSWCSSRAA